MGTSPAQSSTTSGSVSGCVLAQSQMPMPLLHRPVELTQYTSLAFTDALTDAGLQGSIGSVGDALDNAMMESTIGLYKTELIGFDPRRTWRDAQEVETETASWVYWYNHQRLHSSIGDVPPIEYEQDYEEFNITRKAQ